MPGIQGGSPAPLTVALTDTSTGNPIHTYTVNLTINTQIDPATPPRGDVTGDGIVDISDVAKIAYMAVGKPL